MKKSLKLNYIYSSIYQILLIILPLLTSPYVSRVLGSTGLGIYSYTYSLANTFALFGMLGVNNYGNRTIAAVQDDKDKRSQIFWDIWSLQLIFSCVVFFFYLVYIFFVCPQEYKLISYIHCITVICSMVDINWFFFGMEKFKLTVTRNIIIKIINVILIFTLVNSSKDLWLYNLVIVGGMLLSNLSIWPFLKSEVYFKKTNIKNMLTHLKPMLTLFVPVIAVTVYKRLDKVMLGMFSSMSQTGYFENTEKIINIPMSLITALGMVMLPRMSYLFARGKSEESEKYIAYSMEFVCFMSSAMIFGLAGISKDFVPIFFGSEFIEVSNLIVLMVPTIFFISWANVIRTQYLMPLHYDKIYIVSVWIGAIINIFANWYLIPMYGAKGAVIGTVLAEFFVMFYQSFKVRKILPVGPFLLNGLYYFFAGFLMLISVKFVSITFGNKGIWTVSFEILTGIFVYALLCIPYLMYKHKNICVWVKSKK